MADLTKETIEELRGLLAKATPGPWRTHLVDDTTIVADGTGEVATTWQNGGVDADADFDAPTEQYEADAALIVAMRNALPALLDAASSTLTNDYKPSVVIFNDSPRAEFVMRDCATIYRDTDHPAVQEVLDMDSREVIGMCVELPHASTLTADAGDGQSAADTRQIISEGELKTDNGTSWATDWIGIAQEGFENWKAKPHNARWFRKIDGTPIPNDLTICIGEAFAARLRYLAGKLAEARELFENAVEQIAVMRASLEYKAQQDLLALNNSLAARAEAAETRLTTALAALGEARKALRVCERQLRYVGNGTEDPAIHDTAETARATLAKLNALEGNEDGTR